MKILQLNNYPIFIVSNGDEEIIGEIKQNVSWEEVSEEEDQHEKWAPAIREIERGEYIFCPVNGYRYNGDDLKQIHTKLKKLNRSLTQ